MIGFSVKISLFEMALKDEKHGSIAVIAFENTIIRRSLESLAGNWRHGLPGSFVLLQMNALEPAYDSVYFQTKAMQFTLKEVSLLQALYFLEQPTPRGMRPSGRR